MQNVSNSIKWDKIIEALKLMDVLKYLQELIASYFTDRILQHDTNDGPKE